jgi:hypothetical protein
VDGAVTSAGNYQKAVFFCCFGSDFACMTGKLRIDDLRFAFMFA